MLVECFLETARRTPEKVAARDATRWLTYAQLVTFARAVRRIVLAETDAERVGVMLPASVAGLGTILGTLWAGKTIVPLNFLLPARELAAIIADARIDRVVSTQYFESLLAEIPIRTLYLERISLKRRYLCEKLRRTPRPPLVSGDDLAAIVYTSGSTGEPRGVCLSHGNLLFNARAAIEHLQITRDHHLLGILPPFHIFGLLIDVLIPAALDIAITYLPRFSPQAVYKLIGEGEITTILAIPSMYAAIARLKTIDRAHFANIRLAVSGGEPLSRKVYDEVSERTGMTLIEGYGMTETSPVISANQPWAHKTGTVGRPLAGVQTEVRDATGRAVAVGQEGELCVRGRLVMQGYFHRPEQTAQVLDSDGWLRTGDIVRIDDEGFISITGRAKEMMIVGGENVFPREVETVLEQHPDVAKAVVFGQPDATRGEVVIACVTLKEQANCSADDLREFCRGRLAGHKTPRQIHILDDLPRGPTGKILKRQLKSQLGT
ncbi:MAG: class I adenylate-forming enzyme family protein [Alphaproteobacteria bacterium]